ncbi:MAG: hypothetical protein RL272_1257 [Candidatus Parcubacteria bacterium]|jgi:uncharacterized membrane protein YuzA (DUF378 family)
MMMKKMCGVHKVAWALLLVGGVNWLLVGLLEKDLFVLLGLGMASVLARAAYILVGLSALSMLGVCKCCMTCGKGEPGSDKDKMTAMMKPCGCGSGKPCWQCCCKGDAEKMKGMPCPCGSGKKAEDCCMKSPETH